MTTPAIARPAATVLLVRPADAGCPDGGFEVLMARRHARMVFASALVFPGGSVDPGDGADDWRTLVDGGEALDPPARALRIAAARETFEETGIAIAQSAAIPPLATLPAAMRAAGSRLQLDEIVPFAHWITPIEAQRRFDTHFFLCRAPRDADAVCDGGETVALEWATPAAILTRAAAGDASILFPTRLNLARLAESRTIATAFAAARARPRFTVIPRLIRRDGAPVLTIPAAAGYSETENIAPRLG